MYAFNMGKFNRDNRAGISARHSGKKGLIFSPCEHIS